MIKKTQSQKTKVLKKPKVTHSKGLFKLKNKVKEFPKETKTKARVKPERVFTGIVGFDKLLGTGIPKGNSVLIEGGPGSGKTNFCLNVAYNFCEQGKKVLYMSFEEAEDRLIQHMESCGWNVQKHIDKGLLKIKRFDALDISRSVEALLSAAKKELLIDIKPVLFPKDFQPELVLMDSLTSISSAFSGEENRFRIYIEQLFRYLERSKITSILIREVASPAHIGQTGFEKGEAISFLSDGIIVVYNVVYNNGERKRAIEVLKMRGVEIDRRIVKMSITKKGIKVFPKNVLKGEFQLT